MIEDKMSGVGYVIKRERINQRIKQSNLARGICSVSYLSKIENNIIIPNKEIIYLLMKKLNLDLEKQSHNEEENFIVSLSIIYKEGILYRNKDQLKKVLENFTKPNFKFVYASNFYTYHLLMFRLKLIYNESNFEIEDNFRFIKSLEKKLNQKQRFILKMNIGLYYYQSGKNAEALLYFENLLKSLEEVDIEKWQKADFYNMLSTSYLKSRSHFNAISYSLKSITFFKDNHLFNRTIDSYIIISIAQRNLREYEKAKENLCRAQSLANSINSLDYDGIIFHHFGSLYASESNHEKAVEHYKLSYEYKKTNQQLNSSLSTILCIIKEYLKMNMSFEVNKWCIIGMEIVKEVGKTNTYTYQSYFHHFNIHQVRSNNSLNLVTEIKNGIRYFESINDLRYIQKYSIVLGDYFFEINKYKAANIYYQKSNEVLLKQKLVNSTEDL